MVLWRHRGRGSWATTSVTRMFSRAAVRHGQFQALRSCGSVDLAAALDWLCLHVPDEELENAFPDAQAELQAKRAAAVVRSEAMARRLAIIRERNKK